MLPRQAIKLAASMAVQCEPDLMMSPSSPTIDLSAFLNDRMSICSPQASLEQEEETSIDIKSHQHRCLEHPLKKSNIKCFDEGPLQHVQAPVSNSVDQIDVIDLVNTYVPTPQVPQSADIHTDKHPEKEFCCNVKVCVDETSAVDTGLLCPTQVESDWQISDKGPIVPGTADNVKEFAHTLPNYCEIAEKVWTPAASLVVVGRGTKVTDVRIGADGVRGVHLFSTATVFDPSVLVKEGKLGDGQFGTVTSYRNSLDGTKYAVKRVSLSKLNPHEAVVLALATSQQHQQGSRCLVQGHAFFLEGLDLFMVMDQAERTLEQFMHEQGGCVNKEAINMIKKIAEQGLQGIQFLSNNNYVHLDIKPQNIGLTRNNDVKLLDFGSCSNINAENENAAMTPKYAAKEVLYPQIQRLRGMRARPQCTSKGDVYSLGVCLISLLRGSHVWDKVSFTPNSKESYIQALEYMFNNENDLRQQIPTSIDGQLRDLILRMTSYDFTQRCSAGEGLKHPYFTSQGVIHFDFGNNNLSSEQLLALCANMSVQFRPSQNIFCTPPTQKIFKPPVNEALPDIMNLQLPQQTFQQQQWSTQQQFSVMTRVPQPAAPSTTSTDRELPLMVEDEMDESLKMLEAAAAVSMVTQPVDTPVPEFAQIMTNKMRRDMPVEEVAISLRSTDKDHQAAPGFQPAVPEFGDLLSAANDYTKERQPKRQLRMGTIQPPQGNKQFQFGTAHPDFVDLRGNAGGKRMPKKIKTVGPYEKNAPR